MNSIDSTIAIDEVPQRVWDCLVIGAGPAGSTLAATLAHRGLSVLLVDKALFPRPKVCGCCLNGRALAALEILDLADLPELKTGRPLRGFQLFTRMGSLTLDLPRSIALSRQTFDAALLRRAIERGAHFLSPANAIPSAPATRSDRHCVSLRSGTGRISAQTRILIAADGLGSPVSRKLTAAPPSVAPRAWIGAGATLETCPPTFRDDVLRMLSFPGGYLGLVALEDGRLNLAAALDPRRIHGSEGIGRFLYQAWRRFDLDPLPHLDRLHWQGTPPLSQHPPAVSGHRFFCLGDAAGYEEPFTGEGMAWALSSAMALTPIVSQAVHCWHPCFAQQWNATHREIVRRRSLVCRTSAFLMHRPNLTALMASVLRLHPPLLQPLVNSINAPVDPGRFQFAQGGAP